MKHCIDKYSSREHIQWTLKVNEDDGDLELRANGDLIVYVSTDNFLQVVTYSESSLPPLKIIKQDDLWLVREN